MPNKISGTHQESRALNPCRPGYLPAQDTASNQMMIDSSVHAITKCTSNFTYSRTRANSWSVSAMRRFFFFALEWIHKNTQTNNNIFNRAICINQYFIIIQTFDRGKPLFIAFPLQLSNLIRSQGLVQVHHDIVQVFFFAAAVATRLSFSILARFNVGVCS